MKRGCSFDEFYYVCGVGAWLSGGTRFLLPFIGVFFIFLFSCFFCCCFAGVVLIGLFCDSLGPCACGVFWSPGALVVCVWLDTFWLLVVRLFCWLCGVVFGACFGLPTQRPLIRCDL